MDERVPCPACGGAGGGPFGRAGSAWDSEDLVCERCEGVGSVLVTETIRPGLAKTATPSVAPDAKPGERKRTA